MKLKKQIFFFSTLLFILGCDPHDGKLTLINNSTDTIYYTIAYGRDSILNYPIVEKNGEEDFLYSNYLSPKEEIHIPVMDTWEYYINEKCKDSTLRVFFFNKDLIKTAGKDSIMKHHLYSKREKLKLKDLEKLKWRITYP